MKPERDKILFLENPRDLARTGAGIFASAAKRGLEEKGYFTAAISGGSSPRPLYRLLIKEPYLSGIPWSGTHIFWVDERCVPEDDPASNYGAARGDFLDLTPIPPDHVHRMPGEAPPEHGALNYQEELKDFFRLNRGELPVFDLILLGIGPDGHTASLFPGQASLGEKEKLIVAVKGGDPLVSRLTMTFPVLNNAKNIIFIAQGRGKSRILKEVFNQRQKSLPAQMIQPVRGELIWLIDREAASLLHGDIENGPSRR